MRIPTVFTILLASPVFLTHGLPIQAAVSISSAASAQIGSLPGKIAIRRCLDGRTTGNHIVTIHDGRPRTPVLGLVRSEVVEVDFVNSFIGSFDNGTLEAIQGHPDVASITEECFMKTGAILHTMTQDHAPWSLARLTASHRLRFTPATVKDLSYSFYSAGACADVYIVDSGINIHHEAFQGRAIWGASFGNYGVNATIDENGHGTHVAGIVGSSLYGVAKGVRLIAVKVAGRGIDLVIGDVLRGLEWISHHSQTTGRPSVVNLSFSADGPYAEVDRAVAVLIKKGIHVVVSSGNSNRDASRSSPLTVPLAIAVGSSTIHDSRAPNSNYGPIIDIFAPGDRIVSTSIGSNTAKMTMSGTSMATPHVAGWLAINICLEATPPNPAYMQKRMKDSALEGVLTNIPKGTVNRLLHIPAEL